MKETHICSSYNKPHSSGFSALLAFHVLKDILKCTSKATIYENGKWYCKRHAPSKVKEREERKWKNYLDRINRNLEK